MNIALKVLHNTRAFFLIGISLILLVDGLFQVCFANEPAYDGKPLFVVGAIVNATTGVRSLSGQDYNKPTVAGNFNFVAAGDYYIDARIINPTYFFMYSSNSPMVRIALYSPGSCQERYGQSYPGVDKGLVTYHHLVNYVAGLGCVNIPDGSLGWDFPFYGPTITYDPSKYIPAVPLDRTHGIAEELCDPGMVGR